MENSFSTHIYNFKIQLSDFYTFKYYLNIANFTVKLGAFPKKSVFVVAKFGGNNVGFNSPGTLAVIITCTHVYPSKMHSHAFTGFASLDPVLLTKDRPKCTCNTQKNIVDAKP